MARSKVSIARTKPKPNAGEIRKAVQQAFEMIGGIQDLIKPGKKVLLNPS